MKIAVVGGGIFGVETAVKLSKKYPVDLFEKNQDLLQAASGINQFRLHRGYHYPRSLETAQSALKAENEFKKEFSEAIIDTADHYYCISKHDSLTTAKDYIKFCKENNLEYRITNLDVVNKDSIDLCVKVKESHFDPIKLRKICWEKLRSGRVNVFTEKEISIGLLDSYDFIVIAAYANLNNLLENLPRYQKNYQFEVCEKPVIKPPDSLKKKSIVVMDGPFMCIDPFGSTNFSVLGNVVHAIHQSNVGKYPIVEEKFSPLLCSGIIKNPPITNFDLFIESASEFIPDIKKAEHIGSMFIIRTVFPNMDDTDARPTIVSPITDRIITIFSGKIGNCVEAAEKVFQIIEHW